MNNNLSKRIPLESTINTRDLGGYKSMNGKTLKYKRVIRSDYLFSLTENDIKYLKEELNLRLIIDLRSEKEAKRKQDSKIEGVNYILCPIRSDLPDKVKTNPHEKFKIEDPYYHGLINFIYTISKDGDINIPMEDNYKSFVLSNQGIKYYKEFLLYLLNNKEGSVLFHCKDGKDRTGVGAYLFLSLLDVPFENILTDYLKTNENIKERQVNRLKYLKEDCHIKNEMFLNSVYTITGVKENWLKAVNNTLIEKYGSPINYVIKEMNFTLDMITELKNNYLE